MSHAIPLDSARSISELVLTTAPRAVLTDIDGTLTDNGRLTAAAYTALWRLHDAGIAVVPITGRPAGWCDLIVREWPVAAVVGENGAYAMYLADGRRAIYYHPSADHGSRARLETLRETIAREVPESRIASDQPFRLFDLAIDFAEDEPDLGLDTARRIHAICETAGAHAKISSIHVNAWFGEYTKLDMSEIVLRDVLEIAPPDIDRSVLFVGDSPNDEPMFARFPLSVAVAGVRRYAEIVTDPPRYITDRDGGGGFVEVVDRILDN